MWALELTFPLDGAHAKLYPDAQPGPSQIQLIKGEEAYLKQLAQSTQFDPVLKDPGRWLIDPFANPDLFINEAESPEEAAVPKVLDMRKTLLPDVVPGSPSIVTRDQFLTKWATISAGLLDGNCSPSTFTLSCLLFW